MSDTTGNGNLSPRGAEAVKRGLEDLNLVVDELEASRQENRELRTQIAGYKVAMEAFEARGVELESRERTANLERDQAVADRAVYETLFISIKAQLRAFNVPNAPLVTDNSEVPDDALGRAEAQQAATQPYHLLGRLSEHRSTTKPTIVPDTSGSA